MYKRSQIVLFALTCALATLGAAQAGASPKRQAAATPSISGLSPDTIAPLTANECERLGGTTNLNERCGTGMQCTVVKPNGDRFNLCIHEAN